MNNNNSKHIFTQLPTIVLNHPQLNSNDKLVFMVPYDVIKDKGIAAHRNSTIAKKLGISERTVARSLNKLESLGFIVRQGWSFTRKFVLGSMFKLSSAIYTKVKQVKKNFTTRDKSSPKIGHNGNHTKSVPKSNNSKFTLDELQTIKWYKNNSWANVKAEDIYLFE